MFQGISLPVASACALVFSSALVASAGEESSGALDALLRWQGPAHFEESCRLGVGIAPDEDGEPLLGDARKWRLRVFAGAAVDKPLTDVLNGELDFIDDGFVTGLEVGRMLWEDVGGWPLDISANAGVIVYPESSNQDETIFNYTVFLRAEWKAFPWNGHLRTKAGIGEGLSYMNHISYTEMVRREFRPSKHLLNYLDFSISVHLADLLEVTRLDHVLPFVDTDALSNAWLVAAVKHRSGASGVFGSYRDEDGKKVGVTGGDNLFTLGLELEF